MTNSGLLLVFNYSNMIAIKNIDNLVGEAFTSQLNYWPPEFTPLKPANPLRYMMIRLKKIRTDSNHFLCEMLVVNPNNSFYMFLSRNHDFRLPPHFPPITTVK